jgi:hypothetical protein
MLQSASYKTKSAKGNSSDSMRHNSTKLFVNTGFGVLNLATQERISWFMYGEDLDEVY